MKKFLVGAAVAALAIAPAHAAQFIVSVGATNPVPANNNFQADLAGLGFSSFTAGAGTNIALSGPARVKFEYLGSESGLRDRFVAGMVNFLESGGTGVGSSPPPVNNFASPVMMGSDVFAGGPVNWVFRSGSGAGAPTHALGSLNFGVFLPQGAGSSFMSNVVYLGFDDTIVGDDDNHDDFIVRVSFVPEPAAWAMMIAGFGLVGGAMRRRTSKSSLRVVYS